MSERKTPLHAPAAHESAHLHVTGAATYVDDLPPVHGELCGFPVLSPHAHARILGTDPDAALNLGGVHAVLFADDIPGENDASPIAHDEPLLAEGEVHYVGQMVALVVAEDRDTARRAAELVEVEYEPLTPLLDLAEAIEKQSFLTDAMVIARGDIDAALDAAPHRIDGEVRSGAQDHFYLESHAALAVPGEDGTWRIVSSTQHPSECQAKAAEILGIGRHRVVVECPRMGGGFGGKESQANYPVGLAVLGAHHTGRPVRVRFDREQDMVITGKRHPWLTRYEAGYDDHGRLLALRARTYADGGWALDLSGAILQRCLFHLDNAYFIPAAHFEGRVVRTHRVSQTAFRGFGGPQGMVVVEMVLARIAESLGRDPAEVRAQSFYGEGEESVTPWGQAVTHNRLPRIHRELLRTSDYSARRESAAQHNASSRWLKRGLGYQPVKFGISFTTSFLNQAGAYLLVYADGTVQLNHGGTEMGQGLHTKMRAICAHELGVPVDDVRLMTTSTEKVPNTSATAASSGSDLNGQAVRQACEVLRARLRPVAAALLETDDADGLLFADGRVATPEGRSVAFAQVAGRAYLDQVPLAATGYYRTPDLHFDWETGRGKAFHYFAFGGAVVEVELSGLTGEYRLRRVDILHDVGRSLLPDIDRGQVEGGFLQGMGWLTMEEVLWDGDGRLLTRGPSTYKVPAVGEAPDDFRVELLPRAPQPGVVHGSKAVGEPPFMLAISVVTALRAAIASFGPKGHVVELELPATPEAVLRAVEAARAAKS